MPRRPQGRLYESTALDDARKAEAAAREVWKAAFNALEAAAPADHEKAKEALDNAVKGSTSASMAVEKAYRASKKAVLSAIKAKHEAAKADDALCGFCDE